MCFDSDSDDDDWGKVEFRESRPGVGEATKISVQAAVRELDKAGTICRTLLIWVHSNSHLICHI